MNRILVFTGPTLDEDTVHDILPDAEVLPPVGAGDLLRLSLKAGDLVAIIDGFYFQTASVRHKEILDLLQRGIHVWGAASMGAMRAAELAVFGMRGFGAIFRAYCNGEIDGDDEVAVLHAPQDMEYLKLTEALVNIRFACQTAVLEGLLSQDDCQVILAVVKDLPFFERSYPRIWPRVCARGIAPQVIERLRPFVLQKRLDLKRKDALEMLQAAQTAPQGPFHASFEPYETRLLQNWRIDAQGRFVGEQWIPDRDLLTAYQILGEDYPQVHYQLLTRQLTEIAQQALYGQLPTEEKLSKLQTQHEREELIAQFLSARYNFPLDGAIPVNAQHTLRPEELSLPLAEQLVRVAVRLWHSASGQNWRGEVISFIKKSDLFVPLVKRVYQTQQFCNTLQEQHGTMLLARLLPEKVYAWLMQQWHVSAADFDIAVLERGFSSRLDCWLAARPFYLFDKYMGDARLKLAVAAGQL
ncbi:MAG TPA: TfuA-like protein [Ktedonobacteraceae bacterium]|nr:TfuA-like protein [Ktedonobacteraceae bacterium]